VSGLHCECCANSDCSSQRICVRLCVSRLFVYVDSVDLFFCVLIFVSAVKHVSYTSCVWLVQCFGILLAVWGYSGVTRGYGGRRGSCPPPPTVGCSRRGVPNNLALANILLLTKTMRRLDERNKSMFSDRSAGSVVVVLFRHLVIALCSILFFQDP